MQKDCVIILSGGMDSTTLLYEYRERIALAITFDYGANHGAKEIECAKYHCQQLDIEHIIIPLDFFKKHLDCALLQGSDKIPEGNYADENMKTTVVPFRNGIMLSIAAGIAEHRNLQYVMIANHSGDHSIYPDCRPEFIKNISAAISSGTYNNAQILAPYTNITKGEIALRGKELGIDYTKTWSCYKGGEKHCGKCGTCVERIEAMQYAKIDDKTDYE